LIESILVWAAQCWLPARVGFILHIYIIHTWFCFHNHLLRIVVPYEFAHFNSQSLIYIIYKVIFKLLYNDIRNRIEQFRY